MVMTGETTIDAVTVGPGVRILGGVDFARHTSLGKLFHHLDKFLAVVFEKIVRYREYAT